MSGARFPHSLGPDRLTFGFRGGLEMLFSNSNTHEVQIPAKDLSGDPSSIAYLVRYLCDSLMTDKRRELFVLDDNV